MISFDSLTLRAFIEENRDFLTGARIQKIQQPTRRDFLFSIRKHGESRKLYININPKFHHICFIEKNNELRRRLENPKKPPMFCMLLRKYMENALIHKINQPDGERIIEIYIETYNEIGEKILLCLAIELMGKHSNIILYNYDTNIILGCAHNVGAEKSRERELAGTLPYTYPPKQHKSDILSYNGVVDYRTLWQDFKWFSKEFARQCNGKPLQKIKSYISMENINPGISEDYSTFSLYSELLEKFLPQNSVNEMIDNYFTYYQEKDKFYALKTHLDTVINQRLKRTYLSINKIQSQINREENYDTYRRFGDLIMANLYNGKDYADKIEVFDYENNKNIMIELDNTLSLKENANKFYKLYNKGKTSKQKLSEIKSEFTQIKEYLEHSKYFLSYVQTYEDLLDIKSEIINGNDNLKKEKAKSSEPEKITKNGFVIYIGKNSRQNDYIVSKLAKDEDLWFHTKDCAGSHVLLKGLNPPDKIILECANYAKQHSSGANSSKVGIIYTKRKNLKKPPKANPGYVTYKNEKEIIL